MVPHVTFKSKNIDPGTMMTTTMCRTTTLTATTTTTLMTLTSDLDDPGMDATPIMRGDRGSEDEGFTNEDILVYEGFEIQAELLSTIIHNIHLFIPIIRALFVVVRHTARLEVI